MFSPLWGIAETAEVARFMIKLKSLVENAACIISAPILRVDGMGLSDILEDMSDACFGLETLEGMSLFNA